MNTRSTPQSDDAVQDDDARDVAEPVLVERADGVAWIMLNRPEALNAMNGPLMDERLNALTAAAEDRAVRCVMLRGAGTSFCAGGDVAMIADRRRQAAEAESLGALLDEQQRELERRAAASALLYAMPKPTVAVLHGHVVGGGLSLALAADLRIAAEGTRMRVQFGRVGLSGDFGITYFLQRLLGSAKARELMLLDPRIEAAEALRLGLLTSVHPENELAGAAEQVAQRLASGPTIAFGRMKDNLIAAENAPLSEVLRIEALNGRISANLSSAPPTPDG